MIWNRLAAVLIAVQALLVCAYGFWVLGIGLSRAEQVWTLLAIGAVAGVGALGATAAWLGRSTGALAAQVPLTVVMAFGTASYFAEDASNVAYLIGSLVLVLALFSIGAHRGIVASIVAIVLSVLAVVAVTVPPISPGPAEQECAAPAVELFTGVQAQFAEDWLGGTEEQLRERAFAALCQPFARERHWFAIMASVAAGAAVELGRRRRAETDDDTPPVS